MPAPFGLRVSRPLSSDPMDPGSGRRPGGGGGEGLHSPVLPLLIAFLVALASAGCSDESGSPVAPSPQNSGAVRALGGASAPVVGPVSFTPPAGSSDLKYTSTFPNAYNFFASWDGEMLSLELVEDDMRSMREASKPHRMRRVEVGLCPSEPHHNEQRCGAAPLWAGSVQLMDTVALDPMPLAACEGWITVHAAELSDDARNRNGWRNAPCPTPDGARVGSEGTGGVWPRYEDNDPDDTPAAPAPPPMPTTVRLYNVGTGADAWEPNVFAAFEGNTFLGAQLAVRVVSSTENSACTAANPSVRLFGSFAALTDPVRIQQNSGTARAAGSSYVEWTIPTGNVANVPTLTTLRYEGGAPRHVATDTLAAGTWTREAGAALWTNPRWEVVPADTVGSLTFSRAAPPATPSSFTPARTVVDAGRFPPFTSHPSGLAPTASVSWYLVDNLEVNTWFNQPVTARPPTCIIPLAAPVG